MQDGIRPLPAGRARSAVLRTAALTHWRHHHARAPKPHTVSNSTSHANGDTDVGQ